MISIINRYVFKSISFGLMLSILMFLALDVLIGFIQQINAVGIGDFTIGSALFFTFLTIPSRIYDAFVVSSVVGVMLGLGALAASSELIVMQSVGLGRLKIARVAVLTLMVWLIPISLMGEFVVPSATLMAESYRSSKINKDVGLGLNSGVWIRDGNVIFNAKPIGSQYDVRSKNITMNDVTVYELDDKLQVIKISKAKSARHQGENWELSDIEVTEFVETGVETQLLENQSWPSRIEPEILSITHSRPKYLSIRDILKYKNFQQDKSQIPVKYDVALWSKFSYPLLVIATALTGLPFLFGLLRSGGFGQRLLIGVMLGLVLYVVNSSLKNFGEVFHVFPFIVTTLPSLIILLITLWVLKLKSR